MVVKAVGYVRVSTEKQASEGLSLEVQKARLSAYATLYDLELVETIVEAGASARTLERDGLKQALGMLEKGKASALVITKLDRLTRSVKDLGHLLDKYFKDRFALHSVAEQLDTKSAGGRLVINVLMSVGQWESEKIGERTSEVMQHKIKAGEYIGGKVPFGFRVSPDGLHIEPNLDEQVIIHRAKQLRLDEKKSLKSTLRQLEAEGFRCRSGEPLQAVQVRRMLARMLESVARAEEEAKATR